MYNKKDNQFFSDPDSAVEKKGKDEKDTQNDSTTSQKKDDDQKFTAEKKLTEEEKQERIRAIHNKAFMNYPPNSGISGQVFKSKELYIANNCAKESRFVKDIDDQSHSGYEVKNFMIGPVFGTDD